MANFRYFQTVWLTIWYLTDFRLVRFCYAGLIRLSFMWTWSISFINTSVADSEEGGGGDIGDIYGWHCVGHFLIWFKFESLHKNIWCAFCNVWLRAKAITSYELSERLRALSRRMHRILCESKQKYLSF